jgi:hypothetical protein
MKGLQSLLSFHKPSFSVSCKLFPLFLVFRTLLNHLILGHLIRIFPYSVDSFDMATSL